MDVKSYLRVYQIRALRDIPNHNVKAGDLGGFVESEANLKQTGSCWIKDSACVCEDAIIKENALIEKSAIVKGSAQVFGSAKVSGASIIRDRTMIYDEAEVLGLNSVIKDDASVYGYATRDNGAR